MGVVIANVDAMTIPDDLLTAADALSGSHVRLMETVAGLDEGDIGRPSALPRWTVGHVLTHLCRNAEAFVHVLRAAADGQAVPMYPGGAIGRDEAIEAGARRRLADIAEDLACSADALSQTMAELPEPAWDGHGYTSSGQAVPCRQIPSRRLREVEVHHVDLGLRYRPEDWPARFVDAEFAEAVRTLPGRVPAGSKAAFLAWLLDRGPQPRPLDLLAWGTPPEQPLPVP